MKIKDKSSFSSNLVFLVLVLLSEHVERFKVSLCGTFNPPLITLQKALVSCALPSLSGIVLLPYGQSPLGGEEELASPWGLLVSDGGITPLQSTRGEWETRIYDKD